MKKRQIHRQLSLPTGTETLQLREVARQRQITRRLADLFEAWGYRPVDTPIVDYFEVYRRLLNEQDVRQIYRAVDRQGEILALRSDTTMFLAKQLGLHLAPDELPVRVYYDAQIVRAEERNDISRNEYRQAGVELVGVPGSDGDAEIIVLALEALTALGVTAPVLHVGSHAALEAIAAGVPDLDLDAVRSAIQHRRFGDPALNGVPAEAVQLFAFIGTPEEFDKLLETLSPGLATTDPDGSRTALGIALSGLRTTVRQVQTIHDRLRPGSIRIDLSELGSHGYYTGVAFAVYLPRGNTAVLRGGRYDRLLQSFGIDAPSVGFSMFTRKLPATTMADRIDQSPRNQTRTTQERLADGRKGKA